MAEDKQGTQTMAEQSADNFKSTKPVVAVTGSKTFQEIMLHVNPGQPNGQGERPCTMQQVGSTPGGRLKGNGQDIELDPYEGPFLIRFRLTGSPLGWAATDPFTTTKDINTCPSTSYDADQLWIGHPNDRTLLVMDMNVGQPCKMRFKLNFADGTYCDPIIENGGGNQP